MRTIRIIGSQLEIVLPLWVRQELEIGLNRLINVTPVCGMLLLTAGDITDLDITNPKFDTLAIKKETLDIVGMEAYDLIEILRLDNNIYVTHYQRDIPKCYTCGCVANIDLEGIYVCRKCGSKELEQMVVS